MKRYPIFAYPYPLLRIPFADTRRKFLYQDYCRYPANKPIASPTFPLKPSVNPDEVSLADAPLDVVSVVCRTHFFFLFTGGGYCREGHQLG